VKGHETGYSDRRQHELKMPSKTMSKRVFGVGIILTGVVILGAALIIGLQFPKLVFNTNLESLCILSKDHARYDLWVSTK
jgi:hypothetical protein